MMYENKQEICNNLLRALQRTRNCYDVIDLEYDPDKDEVSATFESGLVRHINVECDSGTALIMDVVRGLT